MDICKELISVEQNTLSEDGKFSWEEVECLGSCSNAPMVQIGKDYYEDLFKWLESCEDIFGFEDLKGYGPNSKNINETLNYILTRKK